MGDPKRRSYWTFFLVGLGVGAAVALVFAPETGEKMRRLIAEKAGEGKDFIATKGKWVSKKAGGAVSTGRELLMKGKGRFGEAVQTGKQTYYAALGR
jgi:gas vesicle protein